MQSGMIAFAAQPIMGEIGSSTEEFGLVNAVYASVAIIMIAQQHWMVERIGWQRYLQVSLSFFIVGAFICYFSHSFHGFLIGRAVMALGGASFMTSARLLTLILPLTTRGRGIHAFVMSMIIGMSLAPFTVSWIVSNDRWNMLFLVLIGLALLAIFVGSFSLPKSVPEIHHRMTENSWLNLVLLFLGGSVFFYVFRRSSYQFYSNTALFFVMLIGGAILLVLFFRRLHQREKESKPLMQIRPVIQNRPFIIGMLLSTIFFTMSAANNYILPIMMQQGLGLAWSTIGFYMMIGFSMAYIAWKVFIYTIQRSPKVKPYLMVGSLSIALFGWILSRLTPQADIQYHILPALLINGLFMIFYMTPATIISFSSLKSDDFLFSHAMQLRNIISQLALSIGVSFGILFMQWRTTYHFGRLSENLTEDNSLFNAYFAQLTQLFSAGLSENDAPIAALAQLQQLLIQQSTLMASNNYFYGVMILGSFLFLLFLLQRTIK